MTRRFAPTLAAVLLCAGSAGSDARADLGDTLLAIGYVTSVAAGAVATAVNGSYLAFGEPSPRHWRIFGLVAGGVDLAWGAAAYAAGGDRAEGLVVGTVAIGMGVAALLTASLVDEADDTPGVRPAAWLVPGAGGRAARAGVGLAGRF
jgi:hypothetical protein